jgi:hypothetical protein
MRSWWGSKRRGRIATAAALADYLDRHAALIAQKSIIGYCHSKTRLPMNELMRETRFVDAYARARWEAYAAILADLAAVIDARLRPAAGTRAAELPEALAALCAPLLAAHPSPAERPADWTAAEAAVDALRSRLRTLQAAPPRPIAEIALASGRRVFETLPIHATLRVYDEEPVVANVQFMMVGLAGGLDAGLDAAGVVADLLAPPSLGVRTGEAQ